MLFFAMQSALRVKSWSVLSLSLHAKSASKVFDKWCVFLELHHLFVLTFLKLFARACCALTLLAHRVEENEARPGLVLYVNARKCIKTASSQLFSRCLDSRASGAFARANKSWKITESLVERQNSSNLTDKLGIRVECSPMMMDITFGCNPHGHAAKPAILTPSCNVGFAYISVATWHYAFRRCNSGVFLCSLRHNRCGRCDTPSKEWVLCKAYTIYIFLDLQRYGLHSSTSWEMSSTIPWIFSPTKCAQGMASAHSVAQRFCQCSMTLSFVNVQTILVLSCADLSTQRFCEKAIKFEGVLSLFVSI